MLLTPRQLDVIGLLARGLSCRGVGDLLGLTEQTVKWHAMRIRRNLGARNNAHAVAIALQERMIVP